MSVVIVFVFCVFLVGGVIQSIVQYVVLSVRVRVVQYGVLLQWIVSVCVVLCLPSPLRVVKNQGSHGL